ncbi:MULTISPECIES: heliorhodopsin HeR [unclassified Rhodococcus (in: high G+C Gram-positive bacteria)]|uniref:heliorhodopsin HeR n=1 Tax=unclassified Rhodococcus (in: high G+C Gram-positive bacteria) TaxID=192944 RepID=UPI002955581E|nr:MULTISPECIES: heliorhodopsin HeR [unclassified Rhodococcus (in: high G+C Gram-positive bacteria)]MDV7990037.1 heliorhodopsin HeR [Rhodococcus sp. IEGM 1374]MDV8056207.1 heliorhodopsin HeR [Rhodococcus sp. IEGM 1343]MDV8078765.1 heliorhodopsin HeR [Rhodococcus sp. IEGM 1370]
MARTPHPAVATEHPLSPDRLRRLRIWNLALSALHAVQAVAVLVIASDFAIDVTTAYPAGPPGTVVPQAQEAFAVPIGIAVAVFLALAAVDHFATGVPLRKSYERNLSRGINPFRWLEYSVSATIMVVLIALYAGITQISALIAIVGANVAMILFGWLQERFNPPGQRPDLTAFWFGCVAGAAPWVAITVNLVGASEVPGFVYGIFFSLFVFFMSFAANQWLQYRRIGPWKDYAFGEFVYLVLSLAAKSALAWQIVAGSLA